MTYWRPRELAEPTATLGVLATDPRHGRRRSGSGHPRTCAPRISNALNMAWRPTVTPWTPLATAQFFVPNPRQHDYLRDGGIRRITETLLGQGQGNWSWAAAFFCAHLGRV